MTAHVYVCLWYLFSIEIQVALEQMTLKLLFPNLGELPLFPSNPMSVFLKKHLLNLCRLLLAPVQEQIASSEKFAVVPVKYYKLVNLLQAKSG